MDTKQRILLGAAGGITPYLITLLSIDFKSVIGGYELLDWVGLVVRCVILMFLGSLVAYLHKKETEQFKVFQLGIAAPALLATFINGNAGNNQALPTPSDNTTSLSISIFSQAYAAGTSDDKTYINAGMLREPKVSAFSRFSRGVFGTKLKTLEKEMYFVIVGSHNEKEKAEAQARSLANKNYHAKVYNPYGSSDYYAVVIASNVTKDEASKVKDEAIKNGLPKDTYIWKY